MFDQIFERSDALRRQLAAPLLEERLAYLRHWVEGGAPRGSPRQLAQYLLVITKRLSLQSEGSITTAQIKRAADQWGRRHFKHDKTKRALMPRSKARFVCAATNWLRFLGRL